MQKNARFVALVAFAAESDETIRSTSEAAVARPAPVNDAIVTVFQVLALDM